jgi:hypothetical protein
LTGPGTTGLKLVIKKKNEEEELDEEYDELQEDEKYKVG